MPKIPTTRTELIAQYRKLGLEMTLLRENHIKELEALINTYRSQKASIRSQRDALLVQIRQPKQTQAEAIAA